MGRIASLSTDTLSQLLLALYSAPLDPDQWASFLSRMTTALGVPAAALLHQDLSTEKYGFGVATGMDPVALDLYDRHYGRIDPWRPKFLATEEGQLQFGEALCAQAELRSTEFYNDYLSKWDVSLHSAVATVKRGNRFEVFSVYRSRSGKPPDGRVLTALETLVPHVHAALRIRRLLVDLGARTLYSEQALSVLTVSVALLDQDGLCVYANPRALQLVGATDGIEISRGRLRTVRTRDSQALTALIEHARQIALGVTMGPAGLLQVARSAGSPLRVSAIPLPRTSCVPAIDAPGIAVVAVIIRDPDDVPSQPSAILASAYGLTPAETRVLLQLYDGLSVTEIAAANRVAVSTVRAQIKTLFVKTGVSRQSALVRLVGDVVRVL